MKAIKCEMCGSNDIMKQDGYYICQSCGTKYSPEEAKKLLIEGVVQIDTSEKVSNLYTLARRARDNNNTSDAEKYYDELRKERPNDWEANFYAVYYKAYNCKLGEIYSAARSISGCIESTFKLIDSSHISSSERVNAFEMVSNSVMTIADMLSNAESGRYNSIDSSIRLKYENEHNGNVGAIAAIRNNLWYEFRYTYVDDELIMKGVGVNVLKHRVENFVFNDEAKKIVPIIQKYEPDYEPDTSAHDAAIAEYEKLMAEATEVLEKYNPDKKNNNGCYIATAVYGSYDCPQVWTLRRYRDYKLARSFTGREFIRLYYYFSPSLVRKFGNYSWFKHFWQKRLDKAVAKLNKYGYDNTPYDDINW